MQVIFDVGKNANGRVLITGRLRETPGEDSIMREVASSIADLMNEHIPQIMAKHGIPVTSSGAVALDGMRLHLHIKESASGAVFVLSGSEFEAAASVREKAVAQMLKEMLNANVPRVCEEFAKRLGTWPGGES